MGQLLTDSLATSELGEQARQMVEQVRSTGRPLFLTDCGQPAAVLVDAGEYALQQRRLVLMERVAQGKQDIADGRAQTQEEVEALINQWFGGGE